jgi:hypothetical protein
MPDWDKVTAGKVELAKRALAATPRPGSERIPAGQKQVTDFPVLDLGVRPIVDHQTWTLTLSGLVRNELSLTWKDFQAFLQVKGRHALRDAPEPARHGLGRRSCARRDHEGGAASRCVIRHAARLRRLYDQLAAAAIAGR